MLIIVLETWDFYKTLHTAFEENSLTVQYSTVQKSTVQCSTVQWGHICPHERYWGLSGWEKLETTVVVVAASVVAVVASSVVAVIAASVEIISDWLGIKQSY